MEVKIENSNTPVGFVDLAVGDLFRQPDYPNHIWMKVPPIGATNCIQLGTGAYGNLYTSSAVFKAKQVVVKF